MPNCDNLKAVAAAALIVGAVVSLAWPAHAQLGGSAVDITGDEVTVSTADQSADSSLGDIDTQTAAIDTSITSGGGGGDYRPNSQYITSLDQHLFSGINSQNFNTWFPGWQALPANSTDTVAKPMTNTVLTTYGQALATAQSQVQELEGENFSNIEGTSSQTTNLLAAVQANTEAVLADVQEQQYARQLLATLITVEATKAGEELNERAQAEATDAMSFNGGTMP
jgi:hypothetical protein